MPVWPVTLPASPLLDRFRETVPNTVVRTEMDQGPAKTRRRTTAGIRKLMCGYLLSKAQVAILDDFYVSDISGGALSFDFTHPRTGTVVSCRFEKPPEYSAPNGEYFQVEIELEVLP